MVDTFDGNISSSRSVSTLSKVERVDTTLPHRRYNPLTDEWILVSPHRTKRPWNGAVEAVGSPAVPSHDPGCFLCPGNTRVSGSTNPSYSNTFTFVNDHPALITEVPNQFSTDEPLFQSTQEYGTSKVLCYSPDHGKSMARLTQDEILDIVHDWTHEYEVIGKDPCISYVQIFENKGSMMGASSPHPHCQIWATEHIPTIPYKEQHMQKQHTDLLLSYETQEQTKKERIVYTNNSFTILVPYWAVWPFETMILPHSRVQSLSDMSTDQQSDLADALMRLTHGYDRIFSTSFPYSMGLHQKPTDGADHPEWQFHMHFYPPLLRSSTVKKYYVGYELMAEAQRDITPETAAETLRNSI